MACYAWGTRLIIDPQDVLDFSDNDILFITGGHDNALAGIAGAPVTGRASAILLEPNPARLFAPA